MLRRAALQCQARQPIRAGSTHGRSRAVRLHVRAASSAVPPMDFSLVNNPRDRRSENVAGPFYVDRTCINCDTCRWMDPATFGRVGAQSAVIVQPKDAAGRVEALKALLSCPTHSIHVTDRTPEELRAAQEGLPAPVPGLAPAGHTAAAAAAVGGAPGDEGVGAAGREGIYYTGWAAVESLAGCAYLLVRPQGGNILVDSPRFNPVLARRIEALGGVRYMFLTHRDDVGGHEAWVKRFNATRIIHELEANERQGTDKVEVKLRGSGPWVLRRDGSIVSVSDGGDSTAVAATRIGVGAGSEAAAPSPERIEAIRKVAGAAALAVAEAAAVVEEAAVDSVVEAATEVATEAAAAGEPMDVRAMEAAAEAAADAVADAVAEAVTEAGALVMADAVLEAAAEGAEAEAPEEEVDVVFVHTPGHTEGHVCMYYAPLKAIFTGDHLSSAAGAVEGAPQDELYVFKDFNWYSFPEQLRSVAKLLQYNWLHVLPAHGRRARLRDAASRLSAVSNLLQQHAAKEIVTASA